MTAPIDDRYTEHVDAGGRLRVPVTDRMDPTPTRDDWTPTWVNVDLNRTPQMMVIYDRTDTATP